MDEEDYKRRQELVEQLVDAAPFMLEFGRYNSHPELPILVKVTWASLYDVVEFFNDWRSELEELM